MTDDHDIGHILRLVEKRLRECLPAGFFSLSIKGARVGTGKLQITVSGGTSAVVRMRTGTAGRPTTDSLVRDSGDPRNGSA